MIRMPARWLVVFTDGQEAIMNAGGGVRAGHPSRTTVTGPLAPYADGFREDLGGQGYAQHSISGQMGLMAHLSAWLERQDLPVGGLAAEVVEGYLRVRRGEGHRTGITGRAVRRCWATSAACVWWPSLDGRFPGRRWRCCWRSFGLPGR